VYQFEGNTKKRCPPEKKGWRYKINVGRSSGFRRGLSVPFFGTERAFFRATLMRYSNLLAGLIPFKPHLEVDSFVIFSEPAFLWL
jgi:hypothetical protein